jgi:hypothetical protein
MSQVQRVTSEVKDLAGDAQTNIGMDYSWLADVTYNDWQRYHDLMRGACPTLHFIRSFFDFRT